MSLRFIPRGDAAGGYFVIEFYAFEVFKLTASVMLRA